MRGRRVRNRLRSALWFLPSLFLIAAIAQALALPEIEERVGSSSVGAYLFEGGPDGARVLLSMVAGSTLTLMVLVFSMTIVALQLAASQFSPRVLRSFLSDRYSQVALGVFTATFAYSITVLRAVRSDETGSAPFVPRLAVALAFFWALTSVVVFVLYVHHTASSIRVVAVIERIGRESRAMISREFTSPGPTAPAAGACSSGRVIAAPCSGVITDVYVASLVKIAESARAVISLCAAVGDFVAVGAPLCEIHGEAGRTVPDSAVVRAVGLGVERTLEQDIRFGFRQLVDIAERALSPAINDPTTAVQAIDQIHDLLRRLCDVPWPSGAYAGRDGAVRVVMPQTTWNEVVRLAVDEIRIAGAGAVQVDRRLRSMLTDLVGAASAERCDVLLTELRLVDAGVRRTLQDHEDQEGGLLRPDEATVPS